MLDAHSNENVASFLPALSPRLLDSSGSKICFHSIELFSPLYTSYGHVLRPISVATAVFTNFGKLIHILGTGEMGCMQCAPCMRIVFCACSKTILILFYKNLDSVEIIAPFVTLVQLVIGVGRK